MFSAPLFEPEIARVIPKSSLRGKGRKGGDNNIWQCTALSAEQAEKARMLKKLP